MTDKMKPKPIHPFAVMPEFWQSLAYKRGYQAGLETMAIALRDAIKQLEITGHKHLLNKAINKALKYFMEQSERNMRPVNPTAKIDISEIEV